MDSFDSHYESLSSLDMQSLSCQVSRLSPAKSTSSIDQLTHRHGKGDSAYSSFSGGSNALDFASSILPDDIGPHGLQYADLKYVKAVYNPSNLNVNRFPSIDQLYQGVGDVSQEDLHHSFCQGGYWHRDPPPPPPMRLDSFITTKNMENYKANLNAVTSQPTGQRSQKVSPDAVHSRHDLVCGQRVSRSFSECPESSEDLDQTPNQNPSSKTLSQQSSSFIQPEFLKQQVVGSGNSAESQRRRSRSEQKVNLSEQLQPRDTQHAMQNPTNGHIQHKGNFYFVTGVCKSSESNCSEVLSGVTEGESGRSSIDTRRLVDMKEKSPSAAADQNMCYQCESWPDAEVCRKTADVHTDTKDEKSQGKAACGHTSISDQGFHSLDRLEELSGEFAFGSGRHRTGSHNIFYSGPEDCNSPSDHDGDKAPLQSADQGGFDRKADRAVREKRQPLGDLASDKINKETTPLLYHLTGASRGETKYGSKNDARGKWRELKQCTVALRQQSREEGRTSSGTGARADDRRDQGQILSSSVGTLDESYKKYYREKLKDAQSKVLRETSFKRKDLLLSWPRRVKQKSEPRPPLFHSALSFQESKVISDGPASPSDLGTEEHGKENRSGVKEDEQGKENGKPPNVPQPQVARIGSRRRLTPEQKKLCYSEPEKLNQVGAVPTHPICSSLGNDEEALLSRGDLSEQGLVASRKKMFESRGHAFSGFSKSSLKQIQQKALAAYVERKTGHKAAEPQQPSCAQRHSTAGKLADLILRPLTGNVGSRKKLLRPLSAGRILDSTGSSQLTSDRTGELQYQSDWMESTTSTGKSTSVETLLDRAKPATFFRACSISTLPDFQVEDDIHKSSGSSVDSFCAQKRAEGEVRSMKTWALSVSEERPVLAMAPRGKSMEEPDMGRIRKARALSKSSEQLDQLGDRRAPSGREHRSIPFWERGSKPQPRSLGTVVMKQDSAPKLASVGHPSRHSGSPARLFSGTPETSVPPAPAMDSSIVGNSVFYVSNVQQPFSPSQPSRELEPSKTSSASSSSLTSSSTITVAPPTCSLFPDPPLEDQDDVARPDPSQEVHVGRGVTTDPSSRFITPDDGVKGEPQDESGLTESRCLPCVPVTSEPQTEAAPAGADLERHRVEDGDPSVKEMEDRSVSPALKNGKPQWRELVREVVAEDQSLARALFPVTNRKTAVMLMEELLSEDTLLMEEHYRQKHAQQVQHGSETLEEQSSQSCEGLNHSCQMGEGHLKTGSDITEKKRALMAHIRRHLQMVEKQRATLKDEVEANALQGSAIGALVQQSCMPAEYERYTLFVGDLERVVSLLLCLSARLARVRNALSAVGEHADAEEKQSLDNRHRLLCKQQEDAKDLKENLDRRERVVSGILARVLTAEQLQDYRSFVQTKAALLIRQKDLDEKQRLGEEQLESLLNSIPS